MGRLLDDPNLRNRIRVFADRHAAGKRLADMLADYRGKALRLFAIPAGGVPVAAPIARTLKAPLDLIIVRKIQLPWTTEAGFGALDPEGTPLFNEMLLSRMPLTPEQIDAQVAKTLENVKEREKRLRGGRPYPELAGAAVIIVDDGLASGYTMRAAVGFLKNKGAGALIIEVPTALDRPAQALLPQVDLLVCPNLRGGLSFAVADAYENWYDVDEKEVLDLLASLSQT
ncbi:MAG: phosphoribosyltransferase family protein [Desulfobaccales bacterium]